MSGRVRGPVGMGAAVAMMAAAPGEASAPELVGDAEAQPIEASRPATTEAQSETNLILTADDVGDAGRVKLTMTDVMGLVGELMTANARGGGLPVAKALRLVVGPLISLLVGRHPAEVAGGVAAQAVGHVPPRARPAVGAFFIALGKQLASDNSLATE